MSLSSFHHKFILALAILIGAVLTAPVKVHAADYSVNNNGLWGNFNGITPFTTTFSTSTTINLNIDDIWQGYGTLDYASFDANISLGFNLADISNYLNFAISGNVNCDIYAQYNDSTGAAQTMLISNSSLGLSLSTDSTSQVINFTIPVVLNGTPTGFKIVISSSGTPFQVRNLEGTSNVPVNFKVYYNFNGSISHFSTSSDNNEIYSGTTLIKSTIPVGYSNLNFGLNGDIYFFRSGPNNNPYANFRSIIFAADYLAPFSFYFNNVSDRLNSPVNRNVYPVLGMGDYPSATGGDHSNTGSPISVVGDTRPGEYCLCVSSSSLTPLSSSDLASLLRLDYWVFEFNMGWSGDQFSMTDCNPRVSYCHFQDKVSGYYYLNIYFFFTTPDSFDSFIIRKAPPVGYSDSIYEVAFNLSKYVGTINDQLNKMEEQWSANIPGHDSFTSANNQASSAVGTAASLESSAMNDFNNAYGNAGLNSFSLDGVASQMSITSNLITRIYNILPAALKYLIIAVLSIGVMAVIVRAGSYVGGKNGD